MSHSPANMPPPVHVDGAVADLPDGATGYIQGFTGFLLDVDGAVWYEAYRGYFVNPFGSYRTPVRRTDGHLVMDAIPENVMAWDNMGWAVETLRAERLYVCDPAVSAASRRLPWWRRWFGRSETN